MNTRRGASTPQDRILQTAEVFIVRIWNERREAGYTRQVWRGMVEHLATKEHCYFQDLERLMTFVREKAGVPPDGRPE
jgi:hypothetical protein